MHICTFIFTTGENDDFRKKESVHSLCRKTEGQTKIRITNTDRSQATHWLEF